MAGKLNVSIRQAGNGVIVYAKIVADHSVEGEYVFTSFEALEAHLRGIFAMPDSVPLKEIDNG